MRRSCERTALRLVQGLAVATAIVAVVRALTSPGIRRALARLTDRVGRKLRFWSGRLSGVAYRVPGDELDQFLGHLPHDVRVMRAKPRRAGARAKAVRTVPQLIATVSPVTAPLAADEIEHVVEAARRRVSGFSP